MSMVLYSRGWLLIWHLNANNAYSSNEFDGVSNGSARKMLFSENRENRCRYREKKSSEPPVPPCFAL